MVLAAMPSGSGDGFVLAERPDVNVRPSMDFDSDFRPSTLLRTGRALADACRDDRRGVLVAGCGVQSEAVRQVQRIVRIHHHGSTCRHGDAVGFGPRVSSAKPQRSCQTLPWMEARVGAGEDPSGVGVSGADPNGNRPQALRKRLSRRARPQGPRPGNRVRIDGGRRARRR